MTEAREECGLVARCPSCGGRIRLGTSAVGGGWTCDRCMGVYPAVDGVLVLGSVQDAGDYPGGAEELVAEVEQDHFWFRERNRLIIATCESVSGTLAGRRILEVGCGTGFVLEGLEKAGGIVCGVDSSLVGLRYARRRVSGPLIRCDAGDLPFDREFDLAFLCDVIEHSSDDAAVLRAAAQALKPGGLVVITVPAHAWLWSPLDVASGHKRRYSRAGLAAVMRQANFDVLRTRYFGGLLVPIQLAHRWTLRRFDARTAASSKVLLHAALRVPPKSVNRLLRVLMRADLALGDRRWPFGSSLIAVGRVGARAASGLV